MNTIVFEEYNNPKKSYRSYDDLSLILNGKTIGAPAPKVLTVDIAGGDGVLDYTEYFGQTNYANRTLKFEFSLIDEPKLFLEQYSRIQNLLNGRKMKITLSDDSDWYYVGRVMVNDWESQKRIGKVVIDVDAEPYKLKHALTVIYKSISAETVINCKNTRKTVIPKISFTTAGAKGKISVAGQESSEFTGTLPETFTVIFGEGENVIKANPSAGATLPMGVRIEYREGSL